MENLQKNFEKLLNGIFAPYFWQSKIRVEIQTDKQDGSLLVSVSQGVHGSVFYFPSNYAYNPAVLAEEVLKAFALAKASKEIKKFERHLSAVQGL